VVLQGETGWEAFDPQEDRLITSDEIGPLFIKGHGHGVGIVNELAASNFKPKKKRRFGLF
jgi:hypothetical protein